VTSMNSSSSVGNGTEVPGLWVMEKNWRDRLESFDFGANPNATNGPAAAAAASMANSAASARMNDRSSRYISNLNNYSSLTTADFTVGVLGSGQVFGELAVLDPEGEVLSPVSAISFTPVELYVFESEALVDVGAAYDSNTTNTLNDSINLHNPPAEKLAYYFRQKYIWEKRKDDLLQNVAKESTKTNVGLAHSISGGGGGGGGGGSDSTSGSVSVRGGSKNARVARHSRKFA
jgi:hypothetical protein